MTDTISNTISHSRRRARLTQAALAQKIGCNTQYLSQVETGRKEVSLKMLRQIASACGCRVEVKLVKQRG